MRLPFLDHPALTKRGRENLALSLLTAACVAGILISLRYA